MTEQLLNENVDDNIVTNGDTPAIDVRTVLKNVIAEVYGEHYNEKVTLANGIELRIVFEKKQGICFVRGSIHNTTVSAIGSIFNYVIPSQYTQIQDVFTPPDVFNNGVFLNANTSYYEWVLNIRARVTASSLVFVGYIASGTTVFFNGFYKISE